MVVRGWKFTDARTSNKKESVMKRTLTAIVMAVIMLAGLSANAVQDGKGTNIFGHVRIKTDGTIKFGGVSRTNWPAAGDLTDLEAATNALNIRVGDLETATNALDGRATSLEGATNALDGRATALEGATNSLNANKLDKSGDTATDLTTTGKYIRAISGTQTITNDGMEITTAQNFALVESDSGEKTASVASGATAGQMLIVQGMSDTDYATVTNDAGYVDLIEAVDFSLRLDNTMQLIWNGSKWIEIHRAAKE